MKNHKDGTCTLDATEWKAFEHWLVLTNEGMNIRQARMQVLKQHPGVRTHYKFLEWLIA